jgi:hypothetical protein
MRESVPCFVTGYLTLAEITLSVLAIPASSIPCEHLFSTGKHIATDHRARLGADRFEHLQVLKSAWKDDILDIAAWNSAVMMEYRELLAVDDEAAQWDKEFPELVQL